MSAHAAILILTCAVVPLWLVAGLTDYVCHRAARIEDNAGTRESLLHLLQFSLVGLPVTLALFLDINAGYFLLALVCIVLHHLVAYIDVRYANHAREVMPFEQMVHSFLELLPITAAILLAVVSWPQFLALFGHGTAPARLAPELRILPIGYVVAVLSGALLFGFIPYLEELWRCEKQRRASR